MYQLLAACLLHDNRRDEAVAVLRQGFDVADERGDNMPRDEMVRMLVELGEPAPASKRPAKTAPTERAAAFVVSGPVARSGATRIS